MLTGIKGRYSNLWRIMLLAQVGVVHVVYADGGDGVANAAPNISAPSMLDMKAGAMGSATDANFLSAHKQIMADIRQAGIERQAAVQAHRQVMASIPAAAQRMMDKINLPATLPVQPTIRAGDVVIRDTGPHTKLVYVLSDKGAIDWRGFSVGQHDRFIVHQNPSSVLLNTVVGQEPSVIEGLVESKEGKMWLSNPNGIDIKDGARINGDFLGTTKLLNLQNFLDGNYKFEGESQAAITLSGKVTFARPGKWIAMAAEHIYGTNDLLLAAPAHRLILGGAEAFSLDLDGDSLYSFKVDPAKASHSLSVQLDAQSKMKADRGYVLVTVQEAIDTASSVINADGLVEATKVDTDPNTGVIHLKGAKGSAVTVGGKLSATGHGTTGGKVYVEGSDIQVDGGLDVSGDLGGGQIAVGGKDLRVFRKDGTRGDGTFMMADNTTIAKGAMLKADAIENGKGGKTEVWGTEELTFKGSASVRGGAEGGDGGFTELSTDGKLDIHDKGIMDSLAPKGKTGMLWIDPNNIQIVEAGLLSGMDAFITAIQLRAYLANNAVVLDTGGLNEYATATNSTLTRDSRTAVASGNITIYTPLDLSDINNDLILNSYRNIIFNITTANMQLGNGNLYLNSGLSGEGTLSFNPGSYGIVQGSRLTVPCSGQVYVYAPVGATVPVPTSPQIAWLRSNTPHRTLGASSPLPTVNPAAGTVAKIQNVQQSIPSIVNSLRTAMLTISPGAPVGGSSSLATTTTSVPAKALEPNSPATTTTSAPAKAPEPNSPATTTAPPPAKAPEPNKDSELDPAKADNGPASAAKGDSQQEDGDENQNNQKSEVSPASKSSSDTSSNGISGAQCKTVVTNGNVQTTCDTSAK